MALTKTCPNCNRPVPINVPRCPYCRTPLNEKKTPTTPVSAISTKNAKLNAILHGELPTEEVLTAHVEEKPAEAISSVYSEEPLSAPVAPESTDINSTEQEKPAIPDQSEEKETPPPASIIKGKKKKISDSSKRDGKKPLFARRRFEEPSDTEISEPEEYEHEEAFDANSDGYYDDVLPALGEQINRLPTENVIRLVFILILVVAVLVIAFSKL